RNCGQSAARTSATSPTASSPAQTNRRFMRIAPGLLDLRSHTAEADGVATEVAGAGLACGAATALLRRVERPAADDIFFCVLVNPGAAVVVGPEIVGVPAVLHPLPDVAVHLMQAPRVGLLRADRRIIALTVGRVPAVVLD